MSESKKIDLKIDFATYEAAKYACKNWHYSKCLPKFKQLWIGIWENKKFIGIISFGRSTTPYIGDAYGLSITECVELTRIALKKHETPVSRIISISTKLLLKHSKGIKLLVSYADPLKGHHGGIYQASNWLYIGKSNNCKQYYWRGKWRNDTSLGRHLKNNPLDKKLLISRKIIGKHKYLMSLDEEIKKRISPLSKPYPKREKLGDDPDHGNSDGATPILTLHKKVA